MKLCAAFGESNVHRKGLAEVCRAVERPTAHNETWDLIMLIHHCQQIINDDKDSELLLFASM